MNQQNKINNCLEYPICNHWPHAITDSTDIIVPGFDRVTFFGPGIISGDWGT